MQGLRTGLLAKRIFPLFTIAVCLAIISGCGESDPKFVNKPKPRITTVKTEPDAEPGMQKSDPAAAKKLGETNQPNAESIQPNPSQGTLETSGPTATVNGRIQLPDGKPAPGASIELSGFAYDRISGTVTRTESVQTSATTNGQYTITGPGAEGFKLSASSPGYGSVVTSFSTKRTPGDINTSIPASQKFDKDLTLAEAAKIRGKVVDEQDRPIAGASISFQAGIDRNSTPHPETRSTSSTATGEFEILDAAPGERSLAVTSPHHVPTTQLITAPTSDSLVIRLQSQGAEIMGVAVMKSGGEPVSSATITLNYFAANQNVSTGLPPFTTSTAPDGSFKISNLPAGGYYLNASHKERKLGRFPQANESGQRGSQLSIKLADKETTEIALEMFGGYTLTGRIYDTDTTEGIAGAIVGFGNEPSKSSETAADGNYRLEGILGINPGNFTVRVVKEGYLPEGSHDEKSVSIHATKSEDELILHSDMAMVKAVEISGQVRNSDGLGIGTAQVSFGSSSSFSFSQNLKPVNPDGTFRLYIKPFSTGKISAKAETLATGYSEELTLDARPISGVDVILYVAGQATGVVSDPQGNPVEGAEVSANEQVKLGQHTIGQTVATGVSGKDGHFLLTGLPKASSLSAGKKGFAVSESAMISLEPGGAKDGIELKLKSAAFIAGRVTDNTGKPMEAASISASGATHKTATSDINGQYRIEDLVEGTYHLYANGPQGRPYKSINGIQTGRTDADIVFDETGVVTLLGRVLNELTDQPVTDFNISSIGNFEMGEKGTGRFTVKNLAAGTDYAIVIKSKGYADYTGLVEVPEGKSGTLETDFRIGPGATIVGRVVEKGTLKPLAGVAALIWSSTDSWSRSNQGPKAHAVTSEDGKFELRSAPAGEVSVTFKPIASLIEKQHKVTTRHGETMDMGDIEIGSGGTIIVRVVRGAGEAPVADQTVSASNYNSNDPISLTETTGVDGTAKFNVPADRDFTLSLQSNSMNVGNIAVADGATKEHTFRLGGGKLIGHVLQGNNPARAQYSIRIAGAGSQDTLVSGSTDEEGNFTAEGLLGGSATVEIRGMNSAQNRRAGSVSEIIVIPEDGEIEKTFRLPSGILTGIVLDPSGQPASSAQVSLQPPSVGPGTASESAAIGNTVTTTDKDGRFQFEGLANATYSLSAYHPTGSATAVGVQISDGAASRNLQLVAAGGTIESTAMNYADGKPVLTAWCNLFGPDGLLAHNEKRDASGIMKIQNVPPGSYRAQVSAYGFSVSEKTIEVVAGETVSIQDVIYAAGSLHWNLRSKEGKPIIGAPVQLTPVDAASIEPARNGPTNAQGAYLARGLSPGDYTITAQPPGGALVSDVVNIRPAGHTDKTAIAP